MSKLTAWHIVAIVLGSWALWLIGAIVLGTDFVYATQPWLALFAQ